MRYRQTRQRQQSVQTANAGRHETAVRSSNGSRQYPAQFAGITATSAPPVAQLTQKDAEKYINENKLKVKSSKKEVEQFILNPDNPKEQRTALLRAWNKDQSHLNVIKPPEELIPKGEEMETVSDYNAWDSDQEDEIDLIETLKKYAKDSFTLIRYHGDKLKEEKIKNVPLLDLDKAIKLLRQVAKRDEYDALPPIIVRVGPRLIEFAPPGTKDIYATPLVAINEKEKIYKRAGTSSAYKYDNLSKNLQKEEGLKKRSREELSDEELEKERLENRREIIKRIFETFKGKKHTLSESEAEAVGAIACDLIKGSKGMKFVEEALEKGVKGQFKFSDMFEGTSPIYQPSKTGGRILATNETLKYHTFKKEVRENQLLGQNNCLINAIARAARRNLPNIGELIRIRERLHNIGEMMAATPDSIPVILRELNLDVAVRVHYPLGSDGNDETLGNGSTLIHIYHTGGNHFEADCPNEENYWHEENDESKKEIREEQKKE